MVAAASIMVKLGSLFRVSLPHLHPHPLLLSVLCTGPKHPSENLGGPRQDVKMASL